MNRKEFLRKSVQLGFGSGSLVVLNQFDRVRAAQPKPEDELERVKREKRFIENWLSDLLDTMNGELDEKTRVKLIEGCGRGCFRRHQFKRDLAEAGKGDVEKLIQAMKKNFEVWREGDLVHIRYGEVSSGCYCPVLKDFPHTADDIHCNCTKATHQSIFETALGRAFQVDIVETVRRGGKTCHFLVHLT